ncbi:hypothetical protein [Actinophytocola oryzae]|uniref:Uncharacterized protein n=1 Tax=Actinophytocola oryzae TaxID=502181 RepID=A0A4R7VHY9_9PSEU|nr:hypothetical protein [Actinophytocola oryzae]TDV48785.1 hypothetical protein CLV71_108145 [Actinophytocola oryzae]
MHVRHDIDVVAATPGLRAPLVTGLVLFLLLAAGAGLYLTRPRDDSAVPRAVLDARRDTTEAAARAVGRALGGGLSGLAQLATVVDESMRQSGSPLLVPFQHRRWLSLYLVDRADRAVVAAVGEPPQPAALGAPVPSDAGMRLARVGAVARIVQYAPAGTRYLLVGQLDPARLGELLAPAGTWLLDRAGSVVAGPGHGTPPAVGGGSPAGSATRRGGTEVVAWASVTGALGWTVVSRRATAERPPGGDHRGRAVAFASGLAALTVVVLGAFHLLVLRPIRGLGERTTRR